MIIKKPENPEQTENNNTTKFVGRIRSATASKPQRILEPMMWQQPDKEGVLKKQGNIYMIRFYKWI